MIGKKFKNNNNEKDYVVRMLVEVRENDVFVKGVLYSAVDTPSNSYVRTLTDFEDNFTEVV